MPGRWTFLPRHAELLARRSGRPPGVGNDGHAAQQAVEPAAALDHERLADAGHAPDAIEIGADDLAPERRAFLKNGVMHPRHRDIDAEEGPARDNGRIVDAGNRPP